MHGRRPNSSGSSSSSDRLKEENENRCHRASTSVRRLPNKMLLDLAGNPVLERTLKHIKRARTLDEVVLATTRNPEDQTLIRLAEGLGCPVFAGDENDVLDRFYQAALVRSRIGWSESRVTAPCTTQRSSIGS